MKTQLSRYAEIFIYIQNAKVVEIHSVFSLWREMGGFSQILVKINILGNLIKIRKNTQNQKNHDFIIFFAPG